MSRVGEHDATVAVEAAARKMYETDVENRRSVFPPSVQFLSWDDLEPLQKRPFLEGVLPLVWAALEALPDHRHTAWLEGYIRADNGGDADENPYGGNI